MSMGMTSGMAGMSMAPTSTMGGMSMSMPSASSGASSGTDMGGMEGMGMTCKSGFCYAHL